MAAPRPPLPQTVSPATCAPRVRTARPARRLPPLAQRAHTPAPLGRVSVPHACRASTAPRRRLTSVRSRRLSHVQVLMLFIRGLSLPDGSVLCQRHTVRQPVPLPDWHIQQPYRRHVDLVVHELPARHVLLQPGPRCALGCLLWRFLLRRYAHSLFRFDCCAYIMRNCRSGHDCNAQRRRRDGRPVPSGHNVSCGKCDTDYVSRWSVLRGCAAGQQHRCAKGKTLSCQSHKVCRALHRGILLHIRRYHTDTHNCGTGQHLPRRLLLPKRQPEPGGMSCRHVLPLDRPLCCERLLAVQLGCFLQPAKPDRSHGTVQCGLLLPRRPVGKQPVRLPLSGGFVLSDRLSDPNPVRCRYLPGSERTGQLQGVPARVLLSA
jgi:hypothetical protein